MSSIASVLPYIQIAIAVLLIVLILLQRGDAELGSAFGGDSMGGTKYARRGMEKLIFNATIVTGVLFAITSLLALLK